MVVFLCCGPFHLFNTGLGLTGRLALDAGLSLSFFLLHSGLIRKSTRRRLARFLAPEFHCVMFTIVSGAYLIFLVLVWQPSGLLIESPGLPVRILVRLVFVLSLLGCAWGVRVLGDSDLFGLEAMLSRGRTNKPPLKPFIVKGPYRWVRHPQYLFCLVMIWANPYLTADRLLFNVLWTAWVVTAVRLEERDLTAQFGAQYTDYQKTTPMLIPYRLPR